MESGVVLAKIAHACYFDIGQDVLPQKQKQKMGWGFRLNSMNTNYLAASGAEQLDIKDHVLGEGVCRAKGRERGAPVDR